MKIYTKTGDSGTTGLFGGDRVSKSHGRIEAYGTVDELNAVIGLVRSGIESGGGLQQIDSILERVQDDLFVVGADLATPSDSKPSVPRILEGQTVALETEIDHFSDRLPDLKSFILPGGSEIASRLHLARTVCRRAERLAVETAAVDDVNPEVVRYLNRLSDHLFVLARATNDIQGVESPEWHPAEK